LPGSSYHNPLSVKFNKPVLVRIDEDLPALNTTELAKYNLNAKKGERPVDKAVKLANILRENERCRNVILAVVDGYETFSDLYAPAGRNDRKKLVQAFIDCGLIPEQQMMSYYTEGEFTDAGKDFLESVLSAMILSPDALTVAGLEGVKRLRQTIISSLPVLISNQNLPELNSKLRELGYIRRLKSQVLKDLPDRQTSTIPIDLDNRTEYVKAEADLVEFVRDKAMQDRRFEETIAQYDEETRNRLRRSHAADKAEKAARARILVEITTLKQVAAKGKLEGAASWVQDFLDTGQKLVFFAWHQDIVNAIAERFECAAITGATPIQQRQKAVEAFSLESGPPLISLNMQAGGTGIDGLQGSCSNVALLELGWNDATHDQAISRVHRIGQKDSVNAWYLLAPNTIDDWIFELTEEKKTVVASATDGADPEAHGTLMNELIKRFEEKGR